MFKDVLFFGNVEVLITISGVIVGRVGGDEWRGQPGGRVQGEAKYIATLKKKHSALNGYAIIEPK
jgi:hypothetical protein